MLKIYNSKNFLDYLNKREILNFEYEEIVKEIINNVRQKGDEYIIELVKKYDNVKYDNFNLEVSEEEINNAFKNIDKELLDIFIEAKNNIYDYHKNQLQLSWFYNRDNTILGQIANPIEKIGLYVPGGLGYYPSSVLMNAIPALVANVPEIYIATPPKPDGSIDDSILVCAKLCGVKKIFKTGGAQAIAAFAFGTKTIPKVYKVTGPGNMFVTLAKKLLFGYIDIDSLAGPSEVMILADNKTNLKYLVYDFFSQSEHSNDAQSVLLLPDKDTSEKFITLLKSELLKSKRKEILEKSLSENGIIVIYKNLSEAFYLINEYAPEHLQILVDLSLDEIKLNIKNAAAIFIGEYTPVAIGDYFAGTNHTLPTGGTAKYASPLSVYDYLKFSSFLKYSKEDLLKIKNKISKFAKYENFFEHANSVDIRE